MNPILLLLSSHILLLSLSNALPALNSTAADPEAVVRELHSRVEASRRRALEAPQGCLTGNPIDDCWRCDPDWASNRQRLADCGVGFGRDALGGKGGRIYVVTDPSDPDPASPPPGTLRFGAVQDGPLWIIFAGDMSIRLAEELLVNSFKTLDGRGAQVHIAGGACITLEDVSNVIIHGLHIHDCVPGGNGHVRSSPTRAEMHGPSDGDGVSMHGARMVWVDHCALWRCTDGLIDVTLGSTGITISNNYLSRHDKVMLLGHSDDYVADAGMQVTIAFNRFGEGLGQRMPRCRHGYFHVVNNDYTGWGMYAVGGSANPTINSQGNRYRAPDDPETKEVTKRMDTAEGAWEGWNWRTEGDIMVNGAFFVPSGTGLGLMYEKASSVEPLSAALIDQLTLNAGVLDAPPGNNGAGTSNPGFNGGGPGVVGGGGGPGVVGGGGPGVVGGGGTGDGGGGFGYPGMVYASGAAPSRCSHHRQTRLLHHASLVYSIYYLSLSFILVGL